MIIDIIAVILGLIGLVGCILPIIPGPPISWLGLLLLFIWGSEPMSGGFLLLWAAIMVAVTVLDYVVPAYFTRVTGGSKAASRGSLAGMLAGIIFFPPIGMIVGAIAGAFICEMIWGEKSAGKSVMPALGSFLGFICGTFIKILSSGLMMFYIIKYL